MLQIRGVSLLFGPNIWWAGGGGGDSICVLYALFWSKMLQIRGVSLIFGPSGYKMPQYSSPNPARPLYSSPPPEYQQISILNSFVEAEFPSTGVYSARFLRGGGYKGQAGFGEEYWGILYPDWQLRDFSGSNMRLTPIIWSIFDQINAYRTQSVRFWSNFPD